MDRQKLAGPELLAQQMADNAYNRARYFIASADGDSPIEKLLAAALRCSVNLVARADIWMMFSIGEEFTLADAMNLAAEARQEFYTAYLESQVDVLGWRADFVLHYPVSPRDQPLRMKKLIIECDGHDFHERTKVQAQRDRSRDRLAQAHDIKIFRFTGSEIWADPSRCAEEVLRFISAEGMA